MSAADLHDEDDEEESFQLPLLGLYADLEAGRGSVLLPDEFHRAEPLLQWRILADWQRGLAQVQAGLRPTVASADDEQPAQAERLSGAA